MQKRPGMLHQPLSLIAAISSEIAKTTRATPNMETIIFTDSNGWAIVTIPAMTRSDGSMKNGHPALMRIKRTTSSMARSSNRTAITINRYIRTNFGHKSKIEPISIPKIPAESNHPDLDLLYPINEPIPAHTTTAPIMLTKLSATKPGKNKRINPMRSEIKALKTPFVKISDFIALWFKRHKIIKKELFPNRFLADLEQRIVFYPNYENSTTNWKNESEQNSNVSFIGEIEPWRYPTIKVNQVETQNI